MVASGASLPRRIKGASSEKAMQLIALVDTSIEDAIALQKQTANTRAGVYTDTFEEIISEGSNPDEALEQVQDGNTAVPLPSDLFNLNVELYMADQYGRGNAFDMQMLNGNGGRSNLQAYTSTLRELLSVDLSKMSSDQAKQYMLKAIGDEDVAATVPFGSEVGLRSALYFGMRSKDGAEGSNLDGMDAADVTQAFAYEFMSGLKYMRGGKHLRFSVPSALIGDRDKNLVNELDLSGGVFKNLVSVRTGVWNKTATEAQKRTGNPIESIDFNHKLFAEKFLVPQFQKFEALQRKAIDRVFEGIKFAQQLSGNADIGTVAALEKALATPDQYARATAINQVLTALSKSAEGRKFVAALQMPGSPIVLGNDLVINRDGKAWLSGTDIRFNYSSIFNSAKTGACGQGHEPRCPGFLGKERVRRRNTGSGKPTKRIRATRTSPVVTGRREVCRALSLTL
jgi:hypothetical protein